MRLDALYVATTRLLRTIEACEQGRCEPPAVWAAIVGVIRAWRGR